MGWLWMVPTADDFEPQKDQIRAYEEIGGGGGARGGREKGRVDVKIENATEQRRYLNWDLTEIKVIWRHLVLSELLP